MTKEQAIKLLKRVPAGEYYGDLRDMYMSIAKKNEIDKYGLTKKGEKAWADFLSAILPIRYGISYLTNGYVRYTSTNGLDTFYVG